MNIIIGQKYKNLLETAINPYFSTIIWLPDNPNVAEAVSGHADLSAFSAPDGMLFAAPYLKGKLPTDLNATYCDIIQSPDYPNDAQLNILTVGNYIICNPKTASKEIVSYLTNKLNLKLISVKQGYARCSTAAVGNGLITADKGIYSAAVKNQIPVLKIREDYIKLPGYKTGFIGGAMVTIDKSTIAFTGNINNHPDADEIISFANDMGVEIISLTDGELIDIGSGILF